MIQNNLPNFNPIKCGTKKSHVVFVLDDSGSMQFCRGSTIDGFNEFLDSQKKSKIKTRVSLYKFDGRNVHCVIDNEKTKNVQPLNMETYNPTGTTNLYDAIGVAMNRTNDQMSELKKKDRPIVQMVILTDGGENASTTFSNESIKSMVKSAENKDWTFMFLGANIDAFSVGGSLGFGAQNTLQYNTTKMGSTFKAAARMTSDLRMAKSDGMNTSVAYASTTFTDSEREDAT